MKIQDLLNTIIKAQPLHLQTEPSLNSYSIIMNLLKKKFFYQGALFIGTCKLKSLFHLRLGASQDSLKSPERVINKYGSPFGHLLYE